MVARACVDCGAFGACILAGAIVGIDEDDFPLVSLIGIEADEIPPTVGIEADEIPPKVGIDQDDFGLIPPTG